MKLPPGKYYVGDPCYCFDKNWSRVLEETDFFELDTKFDGGHLAAVCTAHGDGEYNGSDGNSYPVDAGLLGAVSTDLYERSSEPFGLQLIEFEEEFEVTYDGGLVQIGHIKIETDPYIMGYRIHQD